MIRSFDKPGRVLGTMFDYDYASPDLEPLPRTIASYFPGVRRGASWTPWVPHTQRKHTKFLPKIGLVTWDESVLLYNYALQNRERELLEIGCWIGWTSVIFLMGGARLTVVDPVFIDHPAGAACRASIARAGFEAKARLIGAFSPAAIDALGDAGATFSVCFIDGNHEGDAPLKDAQACHRVADRDCVILMHDTIQPNIGTALDWLGSQGWNVGVHYTARFLGVAWRGAASPLRHVPDPAVGWDEAIRKNCPHLLKLPRL